MDVSVHVLRQIDVADSIDLTRLSEALRELEPTRGAAVVRGPERPTGAGVVLRNEPLDLQMRQRTVGGFASSVRLRVFDFGVVGVRFTLVARTPAVADLIGLAAVDPAGNSLGSVVAVHNFGAGDLIEVAPDAGGKTELLPFDATHVPTVDIAAGKIVVVPPVEQE